jgi:hypothetical protein
MKRLLIVLLILAPLGSIARASEKPNTVLIHPGEVIYARFAENGKKLKLLGTSKEDSTQAQLVLTMEKHDKDALFTLKLQNRFAKDLTYKVEIRLLTQNRHMPVTVYPVVTGKMSFDQIWAGTDEVAVYGFELIL